MVGFEREMQEETSMPGRFAHISANMSERDLHLLILHERLHRATALVLPIGGEYNYSPNPYRHEPIPAFELLDPDHGLAEWQKRRNQSRRAKQALIDKARRPK